MGSFWPILFPWLLVGCLCLSCPWLVSFSICYWGIVSWREHRMKKRQKKHQHGKYDMKQLRLGVNIDHIATVRNARGGSHPDPVSAALLAQSAGADGITAHLREDRRHIRDEDIYALKQAIDLPLNFEMAATDEMVSIACDVRPNAACIVPEKRDELTTEGGLAVRSQQDRLAVQVEAES